MVVKVLLIIYFTEIFFLPSKLYATIVPLELNQEKLKFRIWSSYLITKYLSVTQPVKEVGVQC